MKSFGIENQILLVALIPIMLMAVLLDSYVIYSRFADLDGAFLERSHMLANQLASSSEYEVFSGNTSVLHQNANAVLSQKDTSRVVVLGVSEKPLVDIAIKGHEQNTPPLTITNMSNPVYQDDNALILYAPITLTQVGIGVKDFGNISTPATAKSIGAVIIEMSKQRLNKQKYEIWSLTLSITLLTLIVTLILALWAARRIARPIVGMSQALRSFGEKNLGLRILEQPNITELNDLSIGFNQMARQLQHHQEILEAQVAERTSALHESLRNLEGKEKAKSRFLAAASHDLRQPLAAACLFIDSLKYCAPTPKQDKIIQRLSQTMSNFNGLLDSLLNVSKLDAGVIQPEFAPVEVAHIFKWINDSCASLANEKHIRLRLHFPTKGAPVVYTDIGLLKSVLSNLVSNAIKYTFEEGTILVSARRRGGDMLFQVWDTGIGIADEQIKRIFDEFYQVDNPQRDRVNGLGLGLAIAKRVLAIINGKIACRSQVGRGSVFEFVVPLDNSTDCEIQKAPIEPKDDGTNHSFVYGKRFVVIEDDGMISEALVNSLEILGGNVECFDNAECALQHPDIGNADCYIVDYMLPGNVDGINFLNRLNQQLHKHVCAVMVTGDTSSQFMRKAELFHWPVQHKPVNISTLIAKLEEQYGKNV